MSSNNFTADLPTGVASPALDEFSRDAGLTTLDANGIVPVRIAGEIVDTAKHLGQVISQRELFMQHEEMVWFDWQGERRVMDALTFRTWVRDRAGCMLYERRDQKTDRPIPVTLTKDAASTILASEVFKRCVRPLTGMNSVPLPVIRPGNVLELLEPGYDSATGIFTVDSGIKIDQGMDIAAAKANFRRMFQGFPITDERSWSVLLAGFLALYVRHLPGGSGLRPGLLALANKAGSGKSVICKAFQYPVLGRAPTVKMKQGEQLDKELEAMTIASKPVLFFDNVYGGIFSASIDALLSSEEQEGRAMGGHGTFRARNQALLIVSGNKLEANEDAIRRFLVIDLFEKGDPKERKIPRDELLNDDVMKQKEWREMALSIAYTFVRNWHEQGMPEGSITFPTFEKFSWLMGGIIEAAGYGNPFMTPDIPDALNPDAKEFIDLMEAVLAEMGDLREKDFTIRDLARFARSRQIYENKVGTREDGIKLTIKEEKLSGQEMGYAEDKGYMDKSQSSAFGKVISKRAGEEVKVNGVTIECGERKQSRMSTYTFKVR